MLLQYENGEPCSVCGHTLTVADPSLRASAYPSAILPQFLYLGSYDNAARSELLKTLGITHILNVRSPGGFCVVFVSVKGHMRMLSTRWGFISLMVCELLGAPDRALLPDAVQELLYLPHRQHIAASLPRML